MFQARQSRTIVISALLTALIVSAGGIALFSIEHRSTTASLVDDVDQGQTGGDALLRPTDSPAAIDQEQAQSGAPVRTDLGQLELLPAAATQPIAYESDDEHEVEEHANSENRHEQHEHAEHAYEEREDD